MSLHVTRGILCHTYTVLFIHLFLHDIPTLMFPCFTLPLLILSSFPFSSSMSFFLLPSSFFFLPSSFFLHHIPHLHLYVYYIMLILILPLILMLILILIFILIFMHPVFPVLRYSIMKRIVQEMQILLPSFQPKRVMDFGCGPASAGKII